jgi:hypothetical protein
MSLENQIANLVGAANNLTSEVANKMKGIDNKVTTALTAVPDQIRTTMSLSLHVDAEEGDDNNNGRIATPFKTIGRAIKEIPSGASGKISLKNGQVHTVRKEDGFNPYEASDKTLLIYSRDYGSRAVLKIAPNIRVDNVNLEASFVQASTRVDIRFESIVLETGKITDTQKAMGLFPYPTSNNYNSEFGGTFSRGGGTSEAAMFNVQFSRCVIKQQDFRLFTTRSGIYNVLMYQTEILNEGNNEEIFDTLDPKVLSLNQVTYSGFGDKTLEDIFLLRENSYIAKKGAVSN